MRFRGKDYTGKGITVALVDTGVDVSDPRLQGAPIEGLSIQLGATGHAMLGASYNDEHGHGTEMAAAIRHFAPDCTLFVVKIMRETLGTSADLMAAGIEVSANNSAHVINLSLGTPNMGKAMMLSDCVGNAIGSGSVVLAAGHPRGKAAYPADLPNCVGVRAHPDCPIDKFFYFDPKRYPRKQWNRMSGKFQTHGRTVAREGKEPRWRDSGIATAYLTGVAACLSEAIGIRDAQLLVEKLQTSAIVPNPEIGYS